MDLFYISMHFTETIFIFAATLHLKGFGFLPVRDLVEVGSTVITDLLSLCECGAELQVVVIQGSQSGRC